jgi:hypothetical protein
MPFATALCFPATFVLSATALCFPLQLYASRYSCILPAIALCFPLQLYSSCYSFMLSATALCGLLQLYAYCYNFMPFPREFRLYFLKMCYRLWLTVVLCLPYGYRVCEICGAWVVFAFYTSEICTPFTSRDHSI